MRELAIFLTLVMGFNTFMPLVVFASKGTTNLKNVNYYSTVLKHDETLSCNPIDANEVFVSSNEKMKGTKIPGGPDQPEVQSFTPIGMSDMVSPFTGDFSYNIPLMDVDGYPINIGYNAGVTMDQEASWVGLGWNLNPGVINRVMRGIPDDFNGTDKITKEFNLKPEWTMGVSGGAGFELFGFDNLSAQASLGINYNNYNGFSSSVSFNPTFSIAGKNKSKYNFSLGLSGSSQGGPSISPNFSFENEETSKDGKETTTKSFNIGTSFNARGGFNSLSYGYSKSTKSNVETVTRMNYSKGEMETVAATVSTSGRSGSFNRGQSTYIPTITMPKNSFGLALSFKLGPDLIGNDVTLNFSGFFNKKWLKETSVTQNAYGYSYLAAGQDNHDATLDFNRENDGAFTPNTPAIGIPNLTYDMYNVSGHGVSGSYRPYRNDIGYVFDPKISESSVDASIGAEVGMGGTAKVGVDIAATYSRNVVKPWTSLNFAKVEFNNDNIQYREANEMSINNDLTHFQSIGGFEPVKFRNLTPWTLFNKLETTSGSEVSNLSSFNKTEELNRNQPMYTLTHKEVEQGYGVQSLNPQAYNPADASIDHHTAQVTTLSNDGTRYIYGIAAYNLIQRDVSFAIGTNKDYDNLPTYNQELGTVPYNPGSDNSTNNDRGIDHYFNATTTPAYAHSYLLTSVLNSDYVDSDNIPGPSKEDLGGYILFDYQKVDDYLWRNPVTENNASYDEGLNTYTSDDKAHYNYGKKELWYVKKVTTKNHVLIFELSERRDAIAVNGENGGMTEGNPTMLKVDKISLYTIPEYANGTNPNATPIKTVHFEYNYELCRSYPGNIDGQGKLTLKAVYFTYEGSEKGRNNRYEFNYGENYDYDLKSVDRWGNYKPRPAGSGLDVKNDPLRPSDFPYVGQDKTNVDKWVAAWCMKEIKLPSGGRIEIDYESDEYQFVQNKSALEMFKIVGVQNSTATGYHMTPNTSEHVSDNSGNNRRLLVEVEYDASFSQAKAEQYIAGINDVYFRVLGDFKDNRYDFVPGWAQIRNVNYEAALSTPGHTYISIELKGVELDGEPNGSYNPITVAEINFGRMQLSRVLPPSGQDLDDGVGAKDLALALLGAFTSFEELFTGPNRALWNSEIGNKIVLGKSWIRLNTIDGRKLGGGHRVKEIRMFDAWEEMTGISGSEFHYGQHFYYDAENGKSSGVAAYEPQLGNDENPWKQPVYFSEKNILAPDETNYQETPYGEQFFPSASVGYSRVTIKDLERTGVTRTATGKVVHEFYTAKDFPTIVKRTNPNPKRFNPLPIRALFFNYSFDNMSASQGFVIVNNDMHGKPKAQRVYNQSGDKISSVEYFYKQNSNGTLNNEVKMIAKNGSTITGTIGLSYDAVADFRHSKSSTTSGSLDLNFNAILPPFLVVPSILGTISQEFTTYKSASFVKVIEQFGIQDRTVAEDLGSKVETKNLAYDAETGQVLLTETATNFEDKVYSFTYPAHWVYDNMSLAHDNIDLTLFSGIGTYNFSNGYSSQLSAQNGFFVGDEVVVDYSTGTSEKCWVTETTPTSIRILKKNGQGVTAGIKKIKVIRSGHRNMAGTAVGSITLRDNPLDNITTNIFDKVLQAGAVEYVEDWRTFCECYSQEGSPNYSSNPYVIGIKGTWRPKASWTHLSGRTQSFFNNNTNIRQDGMFTSFTPFFKNLGYDWVIDKQNWTYVSSVKEFSPFGQALETVDALGRSSASQFGYNQTFTTAVAANTKYRELGYDGFEDYDYTNCSDNHFKMATPAQISTTESHTGRRSIRVNNGTPVSLSTVIVEDCEDVNPCDITMTVTYVPNLKSYVFTFTGGTAPYQISYEFISGNFAINSTANGFNLVADPGSQFEIKVQVIDANGCVFNRIYKSAGI